MDRTLHEKWRALFGHEDSSGDVSMGDAASDGLEFAPFASELDWRVANWAIQEGIVLRFHRFHMPVAAERPAFLCFPAYSEAAVRPSILTFSPFLFSYAHGRYALTGRFSYRAYSVTLASRDHGLLRVTCHRFAYSYVSRLSFTITIYA